MKFPKFVTFSSPHLNIFFVFVRFLVRKKTIFVEVNNNLTSFQQTPQRFWIFYGFRACLFTCVCDVTLIGLLYSR